jgi:hypothetical protein
VQTVANHRAVRDISASESGLITAGTRAMAAS